MKKNISLLVILWWCFSINAQTFSTEKEKFIKHFEKVMSTFIEKEQRQFINDELKFMLLETTDFPDDYYSKMVETCNLMETKKLKYYPAIYNYVFSVYSFIKTKQPQQSYVAWHNSIEKLLDSRNINKFEDFIELSAGFFSKGLLSDNSNSLWLYRGGKYLFEFNDKPIMKLSGGALVSLVENADKKNKDKPYVDSTVIYDATGTYDPILKKWVGHGGKVTWEKVGLPAIETFAILTKYDISLKTSNLGCDTVSLTTPYFAKPIKGKFSDRAFRITREDDKIYPQFLSFEKRLRINQIVPNVDYEGGFSLQGKDFIGVGAANLPTILTMYKGGKTIISLKAQLMIINKKKISSPLCMSTFYVGQKDSIFHPGLDFAYDVDAKIVDFIRGTSGISQSPFSNTLHQLDMYIPKLSWKYDTDEVLLTYNFGSSQDQRYARLESKSYFDLRLYEQLQGLDKVHPLVAIYDYSFKNDLYYMNEGKVATALGKTIEQAKSLILDLASLGFLNYDSESKMVTVNQKLINFIKSRSGKMDYDNLVFVSDMRPKKLSGYSEEQINKEEYLKTLDNAYRKKNEYRKGLKAFGVLNLNSKEINLDAVDQVSISEPQRTIVFPENNKVLIKPNRDFNFHGWVITGKLEVNALEADYVYSKNTINLFKTEKTVFRVRPMKADDGKESITMKNYIQQISGYIIVDDPKNRSGINLKITDFPKLISEKPSYVFYNQKSVYNGAYDSTRFYYTLDPFQLDSLDDFKEISQRFSGDLTSAGIFPKFREDLKIMPDYSFGFSTKAAEGGYRFYSTEAKYDNKIILSSKGLQGAGTIKYLHSTSISKAYTFLPDSTLGFAEFENLPIEEGIQFPDIKSPEAFITFIPKNNLLKAASTPNHELTMFNKESRLKGTAFLTPKGTTGFGVCTFASANLGARHFRFKRWDIDSDTANFNLKNNYKVEGEDPLALKTENLRAHISFKERKGEFHSNKGQSRVEFPVNLYLCKMDMFTWFMDKEEIDLSTDEKAGRDLDIKSDFDLATDNFFSVHPDQDSLSFRSSEAKYSLKNKTIFCKKVQYLEIADALIYPDSGNVVIRKKARMDALDNSSILANSVTKYHRFINTYTEVKSKTSYFAKGDYPYYDIDSNKTIIKMTSIHVDSINHTTVGIGKIEEKNNFKLSPQFEYTGSIKVSASVLKVKFSGATRIIHNCSNFKKSWMAFSADINPKKVQIPVSENMKSTDSLSLSAGIVWHDSKIPNEIKLYPTFLSELADKNDPIAFTASGFLQYNKKTAEYEISTKAKLNDLNEKGNYLALNTKTCSLHGEGKSNLGLDLGTVSVDAIGDIKYSQEKGKTEMNLTIRYNLPLEEKSFEKIAEKILKTPDLKPVDFDNTNLEKAIIEWTNVKTADKIKSDYTLNGAFKKVPDDLKAAIIFSGVKLISYENPENEDKGLITEIDNASLISVFDKPVMKMIPVRMFFQQVSSTIGGDKFGIQLSNPAGSEYFLNYIKTKKNGDLLIYTTDAELESSINDLKPEKRKAKDFSYETTKNRMYLSKFLKYFITE